MPDYSIKSLSDAELIALAQAGHQEAYRQILNRYVPLVAGFLVGKAEATDAEDLMQEVFTGAFQGLSSLRDSARLGPWLVRICRHKLNDHYRRRGRENRLRAELERKETSGLVVTPEATIAAKQVEDLTLQALAELGEKYRVVLYLRLFEELSYSEIAARLGLRAGTVRIRASRGLAQLREGLGRRGLTPDRFRGLP